MATITLIQASSHMANKVYKMKANTPTGSVNLLGLGGGGISFTCTNPFANVRGATSVDITYDGTVQGPIHQSIQVSSIQP